jgi:hypothetical protein
MLDSAPAIGAFPVSAPYPLIWRVPSLGSHYNTIHVDACAYGCTGLGMHVLSFTSIILFLTVSSLHGLWLATGTITTTEAVKRQLARKSMATNFKDKVFREVFEQLCDDYKRDHPDMDADTGLPVPVHPCLHVCVPVSYVGE